MAEYAASVDIANRALQLLGAGLITSLSANTRNAVQANFLYDKLRVAELRAHVWNFSIGYQTINTTSAVAFQNSVIKNIYVLPVGFLRLANQNPRTAGNATQPVSGGIRFLDYSIEAGNLLTSLSGPIVLRYVHDITSVPLMDALFIEALAAHMAQDLCEVLTNSLQKRQLASQAYAEAVGMAKAINLIEAASDEPVEQDWQQDRLLREKEKAPQTQQQQGRQR